MTGAPWATQVVSESFYRLQPDPWPPSTWSAAEGAVVLAEDGHTLYAKPEAAEDTCALVTARCNRFYHGVEEGTWRSYLRDHWATRGPIDRFVFASLVTDGRVPVEPSPLTTPEGPIILLTCAPDLTSQALVDRFVGLLERAETGQGLRGPLSVDGLLGLPRRRTVLG